MKGRTKRRNLPPGLWLPPLFLVSLILVAPFMATEDPLFTHPGQELAPPSAGHRLGTDLLGRDAWSRLMVGGRRTLSSAFFATAIAIGGGLILSGLTVAAPAPARWFTAVLMDALLAFPTLLLALAILTVLKASLFTLAIALGLANIAPYARVAAAALRVALSQPHIEGARSIGAGRLRILTRHVLPAALPTLAAFASVIFGWILIYGAALAFLGLGGDPSQPDWGTMLAQGQRTITQAPWLVLAPGAALMLSVWLANIFADQVGKSRY